ncbi:hypothetical protein B0H19DRAFT_1263517 [Mycena capillaripes]|nr:hypothetical protein B0H19DRAFT_1263517 [Mycena capillaripes]
MATCIKLRLGDALGHPPALTLTSRWKVFQVLLVEGENDDGGTDSALDKRKRDARKLLISDEQFRAFCDRHEHLTCFVPEPNSLMASSYLILDEYLCFLDKGSGREKQSRCILDVGVQAALDEVRWDQDAFRARGGGAYTIGEWMFNGVVRTTTVVGQRTEKIWSDIEVCVKRKHVMHADHRFINAKLFKARQRRGHTFDEMPKRWGPTRYASPWRSTAEFTPEEFTNLVRILDDGADSMFALRSFQFVRDRSASTDGSDGLMGTQYRPRSFLHSVRPMEFTDYLSTALIPAGVSTPARAAHLSLAPASPPTVAIARCTQTPGLERPESKRVPCPFYIQL